MNKNQWANLCGAWAVLPEWLTLHQRQIEKLMYGDAPTQATDIEAARAFGPEDLITQAEGGVAVIPMHGPMIKRAGFWASLFGFVGTDMIRAAVTHAANDRDTRAILLHIESPGGHVAGVHELATAVREANAIKPVAAHVEDIGASAAYWVASQAERITANKPAEVGSIGTMAVVTDLSAMAERQGIKVHVVSTGKYKGLGVPGTAIEDEHLQEIQRRVDAVNGLFLHAVRSGRRMRAEQLNGVADGRVWSAAEAQTLGLIDDVRTFAQALKDTAGLVATRQQSGRRQRMAKRIAALRDIGSK